MEIGTPEFLDDNAKLHLGLKYGAREADPGIAITRDHDISRVPER